MEQIKSRLSLFNGEPLMRRKADQCGKRAHVAEALDLRLDVKNI